MDAPLFRIPNRDRDRNAKDVPNRVKEMSWANQKPENFLDFIRGRFLLLVLMLALLCGGFSYMNQAASRPGHQRKAKRPPSLVEAPPPPSGLQIVDSNGPITQGDAVEPADAQKAPAAEQPPAAEDKTPAKDPPADEEKTGKEKEPRPDLKADGPDFERSQWGAKESMLRQFQEPLDQFEPLETLDHKDDSFLEIYEMVADDDLDLPAGRANASNYSYGAEIIYHYYRFLRTHEKSPEKIEAYYKQRKEELKSLFGRDSLSEASYRNVMPFPREEQGLHRPSYQEYRGHLYRFTGLLMQKYQIRCWNDEDNNSGIRDTWLLVCRDLKRRDELYGVLVPHSARHLLSRDEVDNADIVAWKGLFLQRWTFENKEGYWNRMPIYVAWNVNRLAQPPAAQGINWILIAIGGVLCIGLLFVFWQTSKDNKRADGNRRNYVRKVKGTGTAAADNGKPAPASNAKPGADAPPSPAPAGPTEATPEPEPPPAPSPLGAPPQD